MWLGITDIKKLGIGLLEGIIWDELSDKRRNIIISKINKLAKRYKKNYKPYKGIKVSFLFAILKKMHQKFALRENVLSADNQYWVDKGWIKN
jgi:hypothetical protein